MYGLFLFHFTSFCDEFSLRINPISLTVASQDCILKDLFIFVIITHFFLDCVCLFLLCGVIPGLTQKFVYHKGQRTVWTQTSRAHANRSRRFMLAYKLGFACLLSPWIRNFGFDLNYWRTFRILS